ncbi:MAG: hypothetical protein RLZZ245_1997 [Verrucomicrobiota bacterium]
MSAALPFPQVIARCSTALLPGLPPRAYQACRTKLPRSYSSLACNSSSRHVGLLFGSCSSSRGFDSAVIDTIAAVQQEELEKEIVSLQAEAERVAEEARELAGEVPF